MNFITLLKKLVPAMAIFVVTILALNFGSYDPYNELTVLTPDTVQATTEASSLTIPPLSVPELGTVPEVTSPVLTTTTFRSCNISASDPTIYNGNSVTISWTTEGFSSVTLNGVAVNNPNGSKTFANVQSNTTYTLVAKTVDGKNDCTTSITVLCVPPPAATFCELTLEKSVSATSVKPGDELTYTIKVKNTGTADCTGGGVKIIDTHDKNISYLSETHTSNITAGYGSTPIYLASAKTLYWNGNTLTPGEEGTIIWKGKVNENLACGVNVTVKNTAKASSVELGNYTTWVYSNTVETNVFKPCPPIPVPTCDAFTATPSTITRGNSANLAWSTSNTDRVIINNGINQVSATGTLSVSPATSTTYILTAYRATTSDSCSVTITVQEPPIVPVPTCDAFTATPSTITRGNSANLAWSTSNTDRVVIDNVIGEVAATGTLSISPATTTTYILTAYRANVSDKCSVKVNVQEPPIVPVPTCDAFTATPSTITRGNSANLAWSTTNSNRVVINNGIGEVSATGTISVTPLATTEYLLTAYGVNDQKNTCLVTLTVQEPPVVTVPKCEAFTATPNSLPVGGGSVVLNWTTTNASAVSISPVVGTTTSVNGSTTVSLTSSATFTLTASDTKGSTTSCIVSVPVTPPTPKPITCESNVTLSANSNSISRGDSATLSWNTTNITSLTFDNGITATGLSGSTSVSPTNTTTYTLTATDGKDTIKCPVTVSVRTSGGGGGGSSSPRCELSVSDNKISRGDKVVLTWDSSRATDLFIEDKTTDEIIVTTDKLSSRAKDRLLDGTITVSPKKDTTYSLTVKRGSSKRTCTVKVAVEDNIVVTQVREQQPLVAGISLSQVPYTGFEAGPILTLLFYTLLMAWALYVAYLIVIRRDAMGGVQFANANPQMSFVAKSELLRPDVFVAKVQAPVMPISSLTPANLPTGAPVVGYASTVSTEVSTNIHNIDDAEVTKIENHAHAQRVLLSSDAIRHFIATTNNQEERIAALNQVLLAAKSQFPSEDGWVVLNEKRMKEVCLVCSANSVRSSEAPYIPAVIPEGAGSLAEAIVTGNVVASYEMIGNRPMFALADAAADLDTVYRIRKGGTGSVSELLQKETSTLTNEQILQIISALTGALDGTYTDEASAVKMAIMKAIKVVA